MKIYNLSHKMIKTIICAVFFTLTTAYTQAANKPTRLFVYGFAASFNDSTVYITNIEELDTAWVDTKTGFLYSRDNYSYQLRDYLKGQGVTTPTCITSYATTRKEAEKKYTALKRRYTTKGNYNVKYVTGDEFHFSPIVPDESEIRLTVREEKELKAQEKARKAEEKAKKKQAKRKGDIEGR